jgi:uncharacterized protein YbgA (DUF1722 family)/uncharacterized protein YbbK (DUF523 family)
VRHDGGHKRDAFVAAMLGRFVRFVPVCPEVELGLGTPREAIHLRSDGSGLRLVGTKSGRDHTAAMTAYARRRVESLAALDLSGYVLKKGSPSCGMERVAVHLPGGARERSGRGLFAARLLEHLPLLPVEEEGRLQDAKLRENFVERVFAYRRLRDFFGCRWTLAGLIGFHTREKMLLLAHDRVAYDSLGRLVAGARALPHRELAERYQQGFMTALARIATRGRHTNVLAHMAGFLKRSLDEPGRRELAELIEDYRRGHVPLVAPITLVRHHVRVHHVAYLAGQSYLEPHPKELALRNHA